MEIQIPNLKCKRCGHKWTPRKAKVTMCPNCKTKYWDKEKKLKND